MLVNRGRTSISGAEPGVIVYLDERLFGGVSMLRELAVNTIYEIRYLSATEAQQKWGPGHLQGVISVRSLRATDPDR
jgi:hypothetical protein